MLITNAIRAKKRKETKDLPNVNVDNQTLNTYVQKLQKMLQCKTVFTDDGKYQGEFDKFYNVLKEQFPNIYSKATAMNLQGCLVFYVKGESDKNVLLMSHHDVVQVSENWTYPPFEAQVHHEKIYARGAVDTKTPLFAQLQAVEELLTENHNFKYNIYVASSNNEEVSGNGIFNALEYFENNKIQFEFVLDEGGAIVDKMVPGVQEKCAMIAVHEKGRHSFKCIAKKDVTADKGHSGLTCKTDNPVARMSKFVAEISNTKWITKLYPEVKGTFRACAPYMNFGYRLIFANINFFEKLLLKIMPKISAQVKDMLGSSVYFTKFNTLDATENIQAKTVEAIAFFRCVRLEDLEKDLEKFRSIAQKYGIEIEQNSQDFCTPASFDSPQFEYVKSVINNNFPKVVVAPFLLTAGTDARRLSSVSKNILRFAPINLSQAQFATVHSDNENIDVSSVGEAVCFYKKLIYSL